MEDIKDNDSEFELDIPEHAWNALRGFAARHGWTESEALSRLVVESLRFLSAQAAKQEKAK